MRSKKLEVRGKENNAGLAHWFQQDKPEKLNKLDKLEKLDKLNKESEKC